MTESTFGQIYIIIRIKKWINDLNKFFYIKKRKREEEKNEKESNDRQIDRHMDRQLGLKINVFLGDTGVSLPEHTFQQLNLTNDFACSSHCNFGFRSCLSFLISTKFFLTRYFYLFVFELFLRRPRDQSWGRLFKVWKTDIKIIQNLTHEEQHLLTYYTQPNLC